MIVAFMAAAFLGRIKDVWNTLALAAILILVVNPAELFGVSFQLTFVALAAIVYFTPGLTSILGEQGDSPWDVKRKFRLLFFTTVSATIGTYPVLAYHFQSVSLAAFASNIVVVPVSAVVVALGLLSAMALPLWKGLSLMLLHFGDLAATIMTAAVEFFSALPYSSFPVKRPALAEAALFYAILLCLPGIRKRSVLVLFFFLAGGLLTLRGISHYRERTDALTVTFISVGQGDSALVEFPYDGGRKRMLIDGGGFYGGDFDTGERIVAPFLGAKKISRIDYVVLSHPQRDHMGGLAYIAWRFKPREFWWSGRGELSAALKKALREASTQVTVVSGSTAKKLINGVTIEFLNPAGEPTNVNDDSLVLKLTYDKRSFLFTGDVSEKAEKTLSSKNPRADVLKVPHHGSRFSSSPDFISAVNPSVAVASAGYNPFGAPHPEVVKRYEERGIRFYSTNRDGAVEVETDGEGIRLRTGESLRPLEN
jgi:competence protein ComEC